MKTALVIVTVNRNCKQWSLTWKGQQIESPIGKSIVDI